MASVSGMHVNGENPIVGISNAAQRARRNTGSQGSLKDPETIADTFILVNAFIEGMNTVEFFPNAPDCSKHAEIFMNEDNATWIEIAANPDMAELDQVRLVTTLISGEFAEAYLFCGNTAVDMYIYVLAQIEIYETSVNWIQAFLQNLVGRGFEFNKLIKNILVATEEEDQRMVLFISGDIIRRIMDYIPIEEGILDDNRETVIGVLFMYAQLLGRL